MVVVGVVGWWCDGDGRWEVGWDGGGRCSCIVWGYVFI